MTQQNRRDFLKTTLATSGAATAATSFPLFTVAGTKNAKVIGANDRIRHAVIGINGRGRSHISGFAGMDHVDITYLCDVDSRLFDNRTKLVESKGGTTPKCVQDVRKVLDDPNVDTISVATCNHWHSLIGIWACQAKKDSYIEKPISHNVYEGRKLAEAAEKYGAVVQHGTQSRSSSGIAREISAVHEEKYGKLLVSKGYCCKPRWSIGEKGTSKAPETLDFDMWLGPAQQQAFHSNLVHYNWHWFWDFGNGDLGNQGVHQMDIARWAIKGATLPERVWSLGGRFGYDDQGETPNTILSVYEYGDVTLLFETRGLVGKHKGMPRIVSNAYFTTEGVINGGKFFPKDGSSPEPLKTDNSVKVAPGGAFGGFINAVRSRQPADNNCDALTGHYSSALCHLGNVSYRLGKEVSFKDDPNLPGNNATVRKSFEKVKTNLEVIGMDLNKTNYTMGPVLEFNPKTEQFTNNEKANPLLTRNYREGYTVPEKV